MKLIHTLKSNEYTIDIDLERALSPEAFATYTERRGDDIQHRAVGWQLHCVGETKYKDHRFELRIRPETVDRAIEALTNLKKRFEVDEIPGQKEEEE